MGREIKFRAWDKLNKKIVTSGLSINLDTTDRVIPISFSQGDLAYCRDNDVSSVPNTHTDIEPMQYTGLKDKNGVEIYEGDIVRVEGQEGDVYYDRYAFCVRHFWDTSQDTPGDAFSESDDIEVIGNIYENPELIKEPK